MTKEKSWELILKMRDHMSDFEIVDEIHSYFGDIAIGDCIVSICNDHDLNFLLEEED